MYLRQMELLQRLGARLLLGVPQLPVFQKALRRVELPVLQQLRMLVALPV